MRKRETFNEINITPLTDIFLVLLIIMMVIAPMLDTQGLSLEVPDYIEAKSIAKDKKILNVLVNNQNQIVIDGEVVEENQLQSKLKNLANDYKDGMLIQTEDEATHGTVVKIMDCARNSVILNISLTEV